MRHHPSRQRIERHQSAGQPSLLSLPPLIERLYTHRGIRQPADADLALARLPDPDRLSGMEHLCEHLLAALTQQARILIVGDYDADGATATSVALRGLKALGFRHVNYRVPNRFRSGYGLGPELVEMAAEAGTDWLLTVDNGMSSHEGVLAAKARGMGVLITDHHLPGSSLPEAEAIVNPNLPGDSFPSKALAGVGVLFYVLLGLRRRLRDRQYFVTQGIPEPVLSNLLDLVALGTVADVVPLDQTNRILVHHGLERIRSGRACPGILALIETAGRSATELRSSDLGYLIAPRLNAAGRLDDMSLGINCLLAPTIESARPLAAELGSLNEARRSIEMDMRRAAEAQMATLGPEEADALIPCLYQHDWHQGVVGILASRIKDRLHRPVIALAPDDQETDLLKGSARSIPGLHIRDLLADVAAAHPGLLRRFGGHAMAAGLTLSADRLRDFRAAIEEAALRRGMTRPEEKTLWSDGALSASDLSTRTARQIEAAGPWGQNFPEPLFDGQFDVLAQRIVGDHHLKMTLRPQDGENPIEAIAFQLEAPGQWLRCQRIRAAFRLEINSFRGRSEPQLRIDYMEDLTEVS